MAMIGTAKVREQGAPPAKARAPRSRSGGPATGEEPRRRYSISIFRLPYPPSANRYWRHVGPRVLISREARAYRARVASLLSFKPMDGDLRMIIDVYRPARRGDLDNALKVAIDSLRGIAYEDDKQITEIHARRFDDKDDPRLEITLEPSHA